MKVITSDSKEFLSKFKEFEFDIVFVDPPYALGSEVVIRKDGKVDYAKASDFMNKWDMPSGDYWEKWFVEAYRTLKHGGWLIMYGMDRQTLLFKYYASLAGFQETQSLYWYFISNFPKATDLSKMIDKSLGEEREVTKEATREHFSNDINGFDQRDSSERERRDKPSTDLAKKYDGYKYSVAPLKQTCETIMVFKKPYKTGSCLHDTLAMENGDDTITCGALDIDGNRVKATDKAKFPVGDYGESNFRNKERQDDEFKNGRYPAQTFIDSQVAEKLDLQSGVSKAGDTVNKYGTPSNSGIYNWNKDGEKEIENTKVDGYGDIGGCSKILHKCDYEQIDYDLFIYEPKVDSGERNNGLFDKEDKVFNRMREDKGEATGLNKEGRFAPIIAKNNHPTLKPIDLNYKILKLFKTPNQQKICYAFAGSGSEILGGLKANFQDWVACEINQEYVDIANARIEHYREEEFVQLDLFDL